MNTIKNSLGIDIPITNIKSGVLTTTENFDDYGIEIGKEYSIHFRDDIGAYIFGSNGAGETRLYNGELRPDVCEKLIWNDN